MVTASLSLFEAGRRCPWVPDPGAYVRTTVEYATADADPDALGAVARFERWSFGEYLEDR